MYLTQVGISGVDNVAELGIARLYLTGTERSLVYPRHESDCGNSHEDDIGISDLIISILDVIYLY